MLLVFMFLVFVMCFFLEMLKFSKVGVGLKVFKVLIIVFELFFKIWFVFVILFLVKV